MLSEPGQREMTTSSNCPSGGVCSATAVGVGWLGRCSAAWSSSEISGTDVSESNGMVTTMDCMLKESLCEKRDGDVSQTYEINQNDAVRMEEETCDDAAAGVPEGCHDVVEMEEECRDASREWCRCKGIYELNEDLMRERCGGILEDAC